MGSPPMTHHGGYYNILNCATNFFQLRSSQRVTSMFFSDESLMVWCPTMKDQCNMHINNGRVLTLLSSTTHFVHEIERLNNETACIARSIKVFIEIVTTEHYAKVKKAMQRQYVKVFTKPCTNHNCHGMRHRWPHLICWASSI